MNKTLVLIALGCFLLSASAFAADNDAKQAQARMRPGKNFLASLNLTDAQKKDMAKLRSDMEKKGVELRAKAATSKIELRDLLMADQPDQAAIAKKVDEVAKREADVRMNRVNGWFETNKLLTPEQQKIWIKALRFATARDMRQGRAMKNGRGRMMMGNQQMRRPMRPMGAPSAPPAGQ